jgi:hypothetical protein
MFEWLKKKAGQPSATAEIRDTLFGDMPLSDWAQHDKLGSPWSDFANVKVRLESRDVPAATALLQQIAATPNLEPRHYLQAWHELRRLGRQPAATEARQLMGVVVEVSMSEGLDILAAYADHSARYFNYSGAAIIWERPDTSLDRPIDQLFEAANRILAQIGVWEAPRPPAPPKGQARINLLTPAGLFFGQAPMQALSTDSLAGPAMAAATHLMKALIAIAEAGRKAT